MATTRRQLATAHRGARPLLPRAQAGCAVARKGAHVPGRGRWSKGEVGLTETPDRVIELSSVGRGALDHLSPTVLGR